MGECPLNFQLHLILSLFWYQVTRYKSFRERLHNTPCSTVVGLHYHVFIMIGKKYEGYVQTKKSAVRALISIPIIRFVNIELDA